MLTAANPSMTLIAMPEFCLQKEKEIIHAQQEKAALQHPTGYDKTELDNSIFSSLSWQDRKASSYT